MARKANTVRSADATIRQFVMSHESSGSFTPSCSYCEPSSPLSFSPKCPQCNPNCTSFSAQSSPCKSECCSLESTTCSSTYSLHSSCLCSSSLCCTSCTICTDYSHQYTLSTSFTSSDDDAGSCSTLTAAFFTETTSSITSMSTSHSGSSSASSSSASAPASSASTCSFSHSSASNVLLQSSASTPITPIITASIGNIITTTAHQPSSVVRDIISVVPNNQGQSASDVGVIIEMSATTASTINNNTFTLVPLYNTNNIITVEEGNRSGTVDSLNLQVSTTDQNNVTAGLSHYRNLEKYTPECYPGCAPYYYETSVPSVPPYPTCDPDPVGEEYINSEHHFYCYSHVAGGPVSPVSLVAGVIVDPVSSFLEEIASLGSGSRSGGDRRTSKSSAIIPRGERRVEFVDGLTRRRSSRLVALRRRSRSRSIISRSEDNNLREGEEESDVEEGELDEEELDEELDEEDDENEAGYEGESGNRRESDFMRFIRSSRSRSPSVNAFRACKRSQMHRMSLLGRPIHVRQIKHVNPKYRQMQNEMHNFLERPRGWKAMTYHIVM